MFQGYFSWFLHNHLLVYQAISLHSWQTVGIWHNQIGLIVGWASLLLALGLLVVYVVIWSICLLGLRTA